jgi:surface protein
LSGKSKRALRAIPQVLAVFLMMAFLLPTPVRADDGRKTIQYNANGGYFGEDAAQTVNSVVYEGSQEVKKYSYTQNLNANGTKNGNYGNGWANQNIRGSDRESAVNQAHVVTIPGSPSLTVKITYGGESNSYDWACVWAGSHPEYTAYNNYSSSVSNKLGGGSYTSASNTKTYTIDGDSVTFGFRSDGSVCGDGYGYYAVITGTETATVEGSYQTPVTSDSRFRFAGWNTEADGSGDSYPGAATKAPDGTTLYAQWSDEQYAGDCGDGVKWKIRYDNSLVIYPTNGVSGTLDTSFGWRSYPSYIQSVTVQPGVHTSESCDHMFQNCWNAQSIDLRNLDTSAATSMSEMFKSCNNLKELNVSGVNTSNVENMSGMFYGCNSFENVDFLSNFDTRNVTDMSYMFQSCYGFRELNLKDLDTGSVTNMSNMFQSCGNLQQIDISGFNTSNVTDMSGMFQNCGMLKQLELSGFNTSSATNMSSMFQGCNQLSKLNLSSFNTSNVTDMSNMFQYCYSLKQLDLSNFNTANVTAMSCILQNCNQLTELDLSNFDTSSVTSADNALPDYVKKIKLGSNFYKYNMTLPTPEPYTTTGKWIKEDGSGEAYLPEEMQSNWNEETSPGVWIWQQNPELDGLTMIDATKWSYTTEEFREAEDSTHTPAMKF